MSDKKEVVFKVTLGTRNIADKDRGTTTVNGSLIELALAVATGLRLTVQEQEYDEDFKKSELQQVSKLIEQLLTDDDFYGMVAAHYYSDDMDSLFTEVDEEDED